MRRLIDLTTISVLSEAGVIGNGNIYTRSECLGIDLMTLFDMFCSGLFSSDLAIKERVNSVGLTNNLTLEKIKIGFQVSSTNKMIGLDDIIYYKY